MFHRLSAALIACATLSAGQSRIERFDADPAWDAHNNRAVDPAGRETIQRLGYNASAHAGGDSGEIGGTLQTAAERAYYAKVLLTPVTFDDHLSASGRLAFAPGRGTGPVMVGFFDSATSFGWRTPNTLAMRIDGRGEVLHAHIEYCTGKWRAGAGIIGRVDAATGRLQPEEFSTSGVHTWSIEYDPAAGATTFTFDGRSTVMAIGAEQPRDGARFDRFGLFNVMKSSDNRSEIYLDDVTINGESFAFDTDPGWAGEGNQREYRARIVRPWFDFGYSDTDFAGGKRGELGGTIFRGDHRYEQTKAYYGAHTGPLTLRAPLNALGRVAMLRGISDSGALLGWFNSKLSLEGGTDKSTIPQDFLGVFVEGPSSEGFMFRPAYRIHGEEAGVGNGPAIYPDGSANEWTLNFTPGTGEISVTLGAEQAALAIPREHLHFGATFDRFGIITTQIDGNYVIIYFDDIEYTVAQ